MSELQEKLPSESTIDEKAAYVDSTADDKETPTLDKYASPSEDAGGEPLYVNGEPVITSGNDVSKYLVDLRDDGDPPITFRSIVLGTIIGSLGAALLQVCTYSTRHL
jgi:hypothetical protein